MILFYAPGGGMGHTARVDAFVHASLLNRQQFMLVTASHYAEKVFPKESLIIIPPEARISAGSLRSFLVGLLSTGSYSKMIIDAFPGGLIGELLDLPFLNCDFEYIARNLKWPEYSPLLKGKTLSFSTTWICEDPPQGQMRFIESTSQSIKQVKLKYPTSSLPPAIQNLIPSEPLWLVVHSGPEEEIMALVEHALDIARIIKEKPEIWIISGCETDTSLQKHFVIDHFPARNLYPFAEKVFTGGGFNCWHELIDFRSKHVVIPFYRKYDDQFRRVKKWTG